MSRVPFSEGAFSRAVSSAVKHALSGRAVGFRLRSVSVRGGFITREPAIDCLGCGPEGCLIITARIGDVSRLTLVSRSTLAAIRDEPDEHRRRRLWETQVDSVSRAVLAGLCRAMFDRRLKAERALQNARAAP